MSLVNFAFSSSAYSTSTISLAIYKIAYKNLYMNMYHDNRF